jgi:3-methyladenine DNA glycosylase AlkC
MAELLKNIYNETFFRHFLSVVLSANPAFDTKGFMHSVFSDDWENLALKQRSTRIAQVLNAFLEGDFRGKTEFLLSLIPKWEATGYKKQNLAFIFLPEFVALFGIKDPEFSLSALEKITDFVSAEFAVRFFFSEYEKQTLETFLKWSKSANENVRRLASEGSRPRLPWGIALKSFQKNPLPCLPILENLLQDPSEYVRKSVANHLNDISKDNPDILKNFLQKHIGKNPKTDSLLKHAARTLLKKGDVSVLKNFGIAKKSEFTAENLRLSHRQIRREETLSFSFEVKNLSSDSALMRLEYAVYYRKAKGSLSRKIFKISEGELAAEASREFSRKISFQDLTTRKHYAGEHFFALVINGAEQEKVGFELL